MPFAMHRGQRIHYTVEGSGPLVVLQHGLLLDAASWKTSGIADALATDFRVACIDSLGHGFSDKPVEPQFYEQEQRAGDIVAVIDDLGYARAHLVGHSMGGWLSVGVAKYYPERLLSLAVGGWDLLDGLAPGPKGPLSFDFFMRFTNRVAPAPTRWVTPEALPGLRACFDALDQLSGAREAVLNAAFPVLLWDGRDDPSHAAMKTFAADAGFSFLSTDGDHLGVLFRYGFESAEGILAFLRAEPVATTVP
ncbi:MAG TPA: alpha/beta hydrolase [Rhizomicrobium sp.]|nr:alpha/beta hydrolase [Rhizomicrobium sp.]